MGYSVQLELLKQEDDGNVVSSRYYPITLTSLVGHGKGLIASTDSTAKNSKLNYLGVQGKSLDDDISSINTWLKKIDDTKLLGKVLTSSIDASENPVTSGAVNTVVSNINKNITIVNKSVTDISTRINGGEGGTLKGNLTEAAYTEIDKTCKEKSTNLITSGALYDIENYINKEVSPFFDIMYEKIQINWFLMSCICGYENPGIFLDIDTLTRTFSTKKLVGDRLGSIQNVYTFGEKNKTNYILIHNPQATVSECKYHILSIRFYDDGNKTNLEYVDLKKLTNMSNSVDLFRTAQSYQLSTQWDGNGDIHNSLTLTFSGDLGTSLTFMYLNLYFPNIENFMKLVNIEK